MEELIIFGVLAVGCIVGVAKLFQPDHIEHHVVPRTRGHRWVNGHLEPGHEWSNGHLEVDHQRQMVKYVDECCCGERRETDVRDIHHKGPRCS